MLALSSSLLRIAHTFDADRPALTDLLNGDTASFGDIVALAIRCRHAMARFGLVPGNEFVTDLDIGRDLAALTLACCESGLHLRIVSPGTHRTGTAPADRRIVQEAKAALGHLIPTHLTDDPARATITAGPPDALMTMTTAALLQTVANFEAAFDIEAGTPLPSPASPVTLERLCTAIVIPMALGLHVVISETGSNASRPSADPAPSPSLQHGYGTPETGFWAVVSPPGPRPANYVASIRPLRSPLRLSGADASCTTGEILLHPCTGDTAPIRTGDVGWLTPTGTLGLAGKLSDVSVHGGHASLLTDVDRLLSSNAAIRQSRTFREHGLSPTEPVICLCVTESSEASVRQWLADRLEPAAVPSRITTIAPHSCNALPPIDTLRAIATGRAGTAVVAALTARRFRRNPAYDEAGLIAATEAALLSGRKLEFLMFWGCGPRQHAAAPDRAAIDALRDMLAAAEAAAPVQACAHIIFTDLHATNNGHSEAHFSNYFAEIRALAAPLDVSSELESAVWRRGGLSRDKVVALERTPDFERRWQRFPLRNRFVEQASRHSGLADKTAAARHYYATCLLERDVLKSSFAGSVFLTYNGPEFNECFPDLPTLYVYPGPRGRNDKPWFADTDERKVEHGAQVAAE